MTRVGLWLAAFALLSQSFAVAAPLMHAGGDAQSAASELRALLGPNVIVCAQDDGSSRQPHPVGHHDDCPLCRIAANAAVLDLPNLVQLGSPHFAALVDFVRPASTPLVPPARFRPFLARAPPSLT